MSLLSQGFRPTFCCFKVSGYVLGLFCHQRCQCSCLCEGCCPSRWKASSPPSVTGTWGSKSQKLVHVICCHCVSESEHKCCSSGLSILLSVVWCWALAQWFWKPKESQCLVRLESWPTTSPWNCQVGTFYASKRSQTPRFPGIILLGEVAGQMGASLSWWGKVSWLWRGIWISGLSSCWSTR